MKTIVFYKQKMNIIFLFVLILAFITNIISINIKLYIYRHNILIKENIKKFLINFNQTDEIKHFLYTVI
jgi:hypothetical protein